MKDMILSSAFEVTEPRAAAVFADPLRRRLVLLLAEQQRSLVELATDTALDLKRLHYHVTALRDLGLVVVKQKRRRAGREIKVYGAVATAFFVSAKISSNLPDARLMAELRQSLANGLEPHAGTLYYLTATGEPRMRPVRGAGTRRAPATEYWRVLKLSRPDVLRLTTSIEDCLNAISKQQNDGKHSFLVHFAIAPRVTTMIR
jgi:DNA-binding transcriptional ArsR family regulator